jgi:hypothetical protein
MQLNNYPTEQAPKQKEERTRRPPVILTPKSVLLGGLSGGLQALPVVGKGRVSEVHVAVEGLLNERLGGAPLLLGPLESSPKTLRLLSA